MRVCAGSRLSGIVIIVRMMQCPAPLRTRQFTPVERPGTAGADQRASATLDPGEQRFERRTIDELDAAGAGHGDSLPAEPTAAEHETGRGSA